jgi:hypothetical protein
MRWFKRDAQAAGISLVDAQGRRADFHALRHTHATRLNRANVPPRIAMELMRHSDLRLTMKTYTDAGSLPMASELGKLPSLSHPLPHPLNSDKTGSDESQPVQSVTVIETAQPAAAQEQSPEMTSLPGAMAAGLVCGSLSFPPVRLKRVLRSSDVDHPKVGH